MQQMILPHL